MRLLRGCAVAGLALAVMAPTAAAAFPYQGILELTWDEDDASGTPLTVPVFPNPRVVPGDMEERSFLVRNNGPDAGDLTVQIINVDLAGDLSDEFYSDFLLNGEPVRSFHGHETFILEQHLEPGDTAVVDLDYGFPLEATSGNYADEGTVQVEFDLYLEIGGVLGEETESPTPEEPTTDTPEPPTGESPDTPGAPATDTPQVPTDAGPPGLPSTGSRALDGLLGAGVLLVAGVGLLLRRRSEVGA